MLKIAICDDEQEMVEEHKRVAEDCLRECSEPGQITEYTVPENLLYDICEDKFYYDMILLDIEMPGFSGMDVAGKIKPYLPDVKIIFITSHIEYAIDAFELSIFRYVPKDRREIKLPVAVRDAIGLLTLEGGKVYTIQSGSRLEKIPYKDILYIQRDGKNAGIVAENGKVTKVRKSLQQVFDELGSEEFIFTDRGCIVNIIHVMQIKDSEAVMKGGERLPVSRSHLQDVKHKLNSYWGEHI
ncbi:MAG: LytTR family DNA-binding domain-containing protein [Lachnospiraceae bacterium]|nr:LytTR family DNA-binding domain-containing protein [Lachnospiraceae bacterium]